MNNIVIVKRLTLNNIILLKMVLLIIFFELWIEMLKL